MTPLLAVSARGGRALRLAASEVVLRRALGVRGSRAARAAAAAAPGPELRREVYRAVWEDAAAACGAAVEDLGAGLLELRRAGRSVRVRDGLVPLDDPVSLAVAGDRELASAALGRAGLAVPRQVRCTPGDLTAALDLLGAVGSVVVKPASGTGAGTAVTCGVQSRPDLVDAVVYAARWGAGEVVVEEQVRGTEVRVLVLDGRPLATVRRRPPEVVGDGRRTLAELVVAENARRRQRRGTAGLLPLPLDLDAVLTQRRAGRTLDAVPPPGAGWPVKTAVNAAGPAQTAGSPGADAAAGSVATAAAAAVGLRLAAVEAVLPPGGGAVVLEVNSTPGLHYHYQPAEDSAVVPVGRDLLAALLATSPQELP
jgi:D-alanine-D-alanine ligase-like ATP-grasp enzyme